MLIDGPQKQMDMIHLVHFTCENLNKFSLDYTQNTKPKMNKLISRPLKSLNSYRLCLRAMWIT